jgi:hypothetical protein
VGVVPNAASSTTKIGAITVYVASSIPTKNKVARHALTVGPFTAKNHAATIPMSGTATSAAAKVT